MKLQFIINSRSCRLPASTIAAHIRENFFGHECGIANTAYPGHARQLAEQAPGRGYEALVAVGGDGTVHEIVNGSFGTNIPIGIIPMGTANDLAERLGIPAAFDDACDIILSGTTRRIDVMKVNGRYFLTTCGIGFPAEVIAVVRDIVGRAVLSRLIRGSLADLIYVAGVGLAFMKRLPCAPVRICCDGRWRETLTVSLIIGLQSHLGKYFTPLPHAHPGDAIMAAYSISGRGRWLLLQHIVRTVRGTQQNLPETQFMHARRITLELPGKMPFFGDGELLAASRHFEIICLPRAAPFFVPQTGRARS